MTTTSAIVAPAAVAVIGLGNMGVPMGLRLIKAGFAVTGFDVVQTARKNFASAGGRIANDVAATVKSAEVVITLLPNGEVVRKAVNELRQHLKPAAIVVDMSSSDPIGTRALGAELIASGHEFVDAPVSGAPPMGRSRSWLAAMAPPSTGSRRCSAPWGRRSFALARSAPGTP